ncbi:MAG: cytochrome b/b6 domain-containing protein [Bacteroidota bacterium]
MGTKIKNDLNQKYGRGIIWTHWLTALLILVLVLSSLKMAGFESIDRMGIIIMHLIIGSSVFLLTIARSFLFFKTKQPDHLKTGSKFVDKFVVWNHYLFYVLLFVISIMGIVVVISGNYIEGISRWNLENIIPPKEIPMLKYHVLVTLFIVLFAIIHILGVAKHYIFTKENTLKRIF